MLKKLTDLVNTYKKYFQPIKEIESGVVSYPMIHISISDKNDNVSWNLDFQYNAKTKNKDNIKLSSDTIPGYIGTTIISDIDRVVINNVSYVIYIKEISFDCSKFNRSELLPCLFEATSKYNQFPINNPDPKYPNEVKIVNESYSQCLYYPKLIDDLDFDYYKADEILEATLINGCSDYSSGTKFNDKYFNDIEFLSYHTIIKRTLPKKYSDVISKIIKERKNG